MDKTRLHMVYLNWMQTNREVTAGQHYGDNSSHPFRGISMSGCLSEMSVH